MWLWVSYIMHLTSELRELSRTSMFLIITSGKPKCGENEGYKLQRFRSIIQLLEIHMPILCLKNAWWGEVGSQTFFECHPDIIFT